MKEIWTHNTWGNWLVSNGVQAKKWCLVETKGNPGRGKKVIGIADTAEELYSKIPKKSYQLICYYLNKDGTFQTANHHPAFSKI